MVSYLARQFSSLADDSIPVHDQSPINQFLCCYLAIRSPLHFIIMIIHSFKSSSVSTKTRKHVDEVQKIQHWNFPLGIELRATRPGGNYVRSLPAVY